MWGLFESETVTTVTTSVNRVIEDRIVPNSLKTGMIKGIFSGDQLVENIMEELIGSIGTRAERMYQYGKRDYPYGAPTSTIHRSTNTEGVAKAIIEGIEGKTITIGYAHYGPLNRLHYAWQKLTTDYGYNPSTNELTVLSASKGFPVYLDDLRVVVTQAMLAVITPRALEQWGIAATAGYTPQRLMQTGEVDRPHTPYGMDPVAVADYLQVHCIWNDTTPITVSGSPRLNSVIRKEIVTFPMLVPVEAAEYVQVNYSYQYETSREVVDVMNEVGFMVPTTVIHYGTQTKYFTYQVGMGTYPELDTLYSTAFDQLGSFFPFGYFRFNRTPTSSVTTSAEYKASRKLMNYLGMNYDKVRDSINENPNIGEVESAVLMMMVPATTTDYMEQRYLFDFFKGLYLKTGAISGPLSAQGNGIIRGLSSRGTEGSISMIIKDARFTTSLGMTGIYKKIGRGTTEKVGTYTSGQSQLVSTETGTSIGDGITSQDATFTFNVYTPYNYYRKQITEHLYEEIQVYNLRMTYFVWGGYATSNSMVPIDHSISDDYSSADREHLYARSLHFVFNAKHEEEIEWYQQEWFGIVLLVIAVVLTILDMGSDGGTWISLALAAGTLTLEALVVAVIVAAIEYLIISLVAKLFVRLLGPEFAMLVAVVAAAYGIYGSLGTTGAAGAPWAKELLSLSSSMMTKVTEHYSKEIEGLKEEEDQFNIFTKGKMDELKAVQDEMDGNNLLSPFVIFGEAPTDYYNRTVHSGNIGIRGIEAISSYVDISLTLPKLATTVGDTFS